MARLNFIVLMIILLIPAEAFAADNDRFQLGYKAVGLHIPTLLVPSSLIGYSTENWTIQLEHGTKSLGDMGIPKGDTIESIDMSFENLGLSARFYNIFFVGVNRRSLRTKATINIQDPTSPFNASQTYSVLTSHAWVGTAGIGSSVRFGIWELQLDTLFYSSLIGSSLEAEVETNSQSGGSEAERQRAITDLHQLGFEVNQILSTHGALVLSFIIAF